MRCGDVLSLLRDYADRELDPIDVERIGAHLTECGECSECLKAERELKLAIRSNARIGPAPAGLAADIKRAVRAQAGLVVARGSRSGRIWDRRRLLIGVAACLLLVIYAADRFNSSRLSSPDSQTPPSRLAVELVDDHIRYLSAEGAPQIETNDPVDAERWFAGRLDIAVNLPRFREHSVILRGGRLCYVLERRVALLFYERRNEKLSLFVMNPSGLELPDMEAGTVKFVTESSRGYKTLCWEQYGLLFALVGRDGLEALVDGAY